MCNPLSRLFDLAEQEVHAAQSFTRINIIGCLAATLLVFCRFVLPAWAQVIAMCFGRTLDSTPPGYFVISLAIIGILFVICLVMFERVSLRATPAPPPPRLRK